jgi:spermidine synthase
VLKREHRRFDAILEDIFVGRGDAVRKPDWIPEPAHRLAAKRLRPGGVLVTNTLDEAAVVGRALIAAHEAVVRIEIEDYDNRIFVAGPEGLSARGLRAAVAASPVLAGSLPLMRFRSWQRA